MRAKSEHEVRSISNIPRPLSARVVVEEPSMLRKGCEITLTFNTLPFMTLGASGAFHVLQGPMSLPVKEVYLGPCDLGFETTLDGLCRLRFPHIHGSSARVVVELDRDLEQPLTIEFLEYKKEEV